VLDFHLPDGDADALLQAIRLLAPELPTVVMSGCDDQDVVTQTLRNGGDDFVSKTHIVDSDELWQRVTRTVMRHRQQRMRRRMSGTPPAAPLARC
jgi:PleD family two-component response regulator